MGQRLVISVPVWGEWHRGLFLDVVLPTHVRALRGLDLQVVYILHSDDRWIYRAVRERLPEAWVCVLPALPASPYRMFARAHRDVLALTKPDDFVSLLNADIILSENAFTYAVDKLRGECSAVYLWVPRANAAAWNRVGCHSPQEVASWAFTARHRCVLDTLWPSGRSSCCSHAYFQWGNRMVVRSFHLHPLMVKVDRPLGFNSTCDNGLEQAFRPSEVAVICNQEAVAVELSPPEKTIGAMDGRSAEQIAAWAKEHCNPMQWWFFYRHRIVFHGDNQETGDGDFVSEVMERAAVTKAAMKALEAA